MKDGSRVRTVRFGAPVYIADLHPFNQFVENRLSGDWTLTQPFVAGYL